MLFSGKAVGAADAGRDPAVAAPAPPSGAGVDWTGRRFAAPASVERRENTYPPAASPPIRTTIPAAVIQLRLRPGFSGPSSTAATAQGRAWRYFGSTYG